MQQPQQQTFTWLKWFAIVTAALAVSSWFMFLTRALQPPPPGV